MSEGRSRADPGRGALAHHSYDSVPSLARGPCLGRVVRGMCAVSSDKRPRARHASRVLRSGLRVRGGSESVLDGLAGLGRFGMGFWVGGPLRAKKNPHLV